MKTLILTGLILGGLASGVRAEEAPPPNSEHPEISGRILMPTPIKMEQEGNTGCFVAGTPGWNPDLQPHVPVNCSKPKAEEAALTPPTTQPITTQPDINPLTVMIPTVQQDSKPQIDCSKVVSIQDKWHGLCMNLNTQEVPKEQPVIK